jgi:hypothetical protein
LVPVLNARLEAEERARPARSDRASRQEADQEAVISAGLDAACPLAYISAMSETRIIVHARKPQPSRSRSPCRRLVDVDAGAWVMTTRSFRLTLQKQRAPGKSKLCRPLPV